MASSPSEPDGEVPDDGLTADGFVAWRDESLWDVDEFDEDDPSGTVGHVAEVFCRPVGPWLLSGLTGLDVSALSADDAVSVLQHVQRASAWLAGVESLVRRQVVDRVAAHFDAELGDDGCASVAGSARRFVSSQDRAVAADAGRPARR